MIVESTVLTIARHPFFARKITLAGNVAGERRGINQTLSPAGRVLLARLRLAVVVVAPHGFRPGPARDARRSRLRAVGVHRGIRFIGARRLWSGRSRPGSGSIVSRHSTHSRGKAALNLKNPFGAEITE
jgi:hypothetical protein